MVITGFTQNESSSGILILSVGIVRFCNVNDVVFLQVPPGWSVACAI